MSTAAVIALAIGVVVVLGAISFATLARKSDVRGAGALSSEAVKRDKAGRSAADVEAEAAASTRTGADAEAETTKEHQHGQQHQIILLKIIKNSDAKQ